MDANYVIHRRMGEGFYFVPCVQFRHDVPRGLAAAYIDTCHGLVGRLAGDAVPIS